MVAHHLCSASLATRRPADDFEDEEEAEPSPPPKQAAPMMRAQAPPQPAAARTNPLPAAMAPNLMSQTDAQQQQQQQHVYAPPPQRRFIAPPSNESRQLQAQRRARLKALRGAVQLRDFPGDGALTLYEAAPLTPYELHTRHQSRRLRVKLVQTGDDDRSISTQTEEIETTTAAAQWPEDGAAPGMPAASMGSEMVASDSAKTASLLTANVGRLRRFLLSAGQVVETLCTENLMAASGASGGFQGANSLPFSKRHSHLELPSAFGERPPVDVTFDATGASLLAAFGKPRGGGAAEASARVAAGDDNTDPQQPAGGDGAMPTRKRHLHQLKKLSTGGMLAQWRLYRPEAPWAVMRCVGVPSCCMLPEAKPHLAFAGTQEGSIQLWNLREPGSSHPSIELGSDRVALRSPTYSSDCLASDAHLSPITQLSALPVAGDDGDLSIASLELEGTLIIWIVLESVELDALDLGQAVGGKERLLRSGTVRLTADPSFGAAGGGGGGGGRRQSLASATVLPTRCLSMVWLPSDASRLLVGTDLPTLLHRSRYPATRPSPEAFDAPGVPAGGAAAAVCGASFCPFSAEHFVVGRADGGVSLHHIDDPAPLLSWTGFAKGEIVQVVWSPSRPSVVWACDEDDVCHLIDITDPSGAPFLSSRAFTDGSARRGGGGGGGGGARAGLHGSSGELDGGSGTAVEPRTRFALDRRGADAAKGGGRGATSERFMAVVSKAASDGAPDGIEVHVLQDAAAAAGTDELVKLKHFLARL